MSISLLREYVRLLIEGSKVPGISEDLFKYASSIDDPGYCIRFTESLKHTPDANRKGLHTTVVNGVYTFPAEKRYLNDLVEMAKPPEFDAKRYEKDYLEWYIGWMKNEFTDDYSESWSSSHQRPELEDYCGSSVASYLGMYLEDIMMPNAQAIFVIKNSSKNPFYLTSEKDLARIVAASDPKQKAGNADKSFNAIAIQKMLLAEGYDVIYDPHDFIDKCGMPQVCFLDNSAFQVVEALATNTVDYDNVRETIMATIEFKQIKKRVRKKAEGITGIKVPTAYIHGPSEAD